MIILEELDFTWKEETIAKVQAMWAEGIGLKEISEKIKRRADEIFLLLMHLALKGKIKKRKGYIWGI